MLWGWKNKEHSLFGKGTLWEENFCSVTVPVTIISSVAFFVYINQLQRISRFEKWLCPFPYSWNHNCIQIKSCGIAQRAVGHSSWGQDGFISMHQLLAEEGWRYEINPWNPCKGGRREPRFVSPSPYSHHGACSPPQTHKYVYIHIYIYIYI